MPLPSVRLWRPSRFAVVGLVALVACGGGGGDGSDTVNDTGTGMQTDTSSSGPSTDATTESGGTSSGGSAGSTTEDTGLDTSTGTMGWTYCDPSNATFTGDPRTASISFDFAEKSCAAMSGAGGPPQLVLEIKPSGLIDCTAFGIEITMASAGLLFEDPPMGDSQVIDLYPGFTIALEGTVVADGAPIIIEFFVTEKGPLIDDPRADFG